MHPLPKSLQNQASWYLPEEEKVLRTRREEERKQTTKKPVQNYLCCL